MWLYAYERYSKDEEYIARLYEAISQMKLLRRQRQGSMIIRMPLSSLFLMAAKKDISLKQACMSMNSIIIML